MKYLITLFCLLLLGCSNAPVLRQDVAQLPSQTQAIRLFKVIQLTANGDVRQTSLLIFQAQSNQWRWIQTDPLGAPVARLLLTREGWQNDGFIMPNKQAMWLFSALATKLNENRPLFTFSRISDEAKTRIYFINQTEAWRIQSVSSQIFIQLADHSRWQINELTP